MNEKDEWQKLIDARKVAEYWMKRYIQAEDRLEQYEWVSVNDRLPEMETDVLVYYGGAMNVCRIVHGVMGLKAWEDIDEFYCEGVTHWMPLPQKPESEDDAE